MQNLSSYSNQIGNSNNSNETAKFFIQFYRIQIATLTLLAKTKAIEHKAINFLNYSCRNESIISNNFTNIQNLNVLCVNA
jgi:hypothetical protein